MTERTAFGRDPDRATGRGGILGAKLGSLTRLVLKGIPVDVVVKLPTEMTFEQEFCTQVALSFEEEDEGLPSLPISKVFTLSL